MSNTLLLCPFCGKEPITIPPTLTRRQLGTDPSKVHGQFYSEIRCSCGAAMQGPDHDMDCKLVIETWNRRRHPAPVAVSERVDEDAPDHATPPAEGEVAELSVVHATAPERIWLYLNGANEYLPFPNEDDVIWSHDPIDSSDIPYIRADLLQQRHPAPVAVSERPPGLKDCNTEGQCWQEKPGSHTEPPGWYLTHYRSIIRYSRGRWLPFHSLPTTGDNTS